LNDVEKTNLKVINRFQKKLYETNLFSAVNTEMPFNAPSEFVRLSLYVNNREDLHLGSRMVKSFFIASTLFLLSPVLPLTYDFGQNIELEVERPDGKTKRYVASGNGTVKNHALANPVPKWTELYWKVSINNINSIVN
jgi:hypothetical protein